jgi:hypothetical protein
LSDGSWRRAFELFLRRKRRRKDEVDIEGSIIIVERRQK